MVEARVAYDSSHLLGYATGWGEAVRDESSGWEEAVNVVDRGGKRR
jgi:hypothetical protein